MDHNRLFIKTKKCAHAQGLPLPQRMSDHASGWDVVAAVTEPIILSPRERKLIPTGLVVEIPLGFEIQVRPRSGLALKHGVTLLNTPGTIDADYRGEIGIIMINLGLEPFTIFRGLRIAQFVIAKVDTELSFMEEGNLSETIRGEGGFGHTGN